MSSSPSEVERITHEVAKSVPADDEMTASDPEGANLGRDDALGAAYDILQALNDSCRVEQATLRRHYRSSSTSTSPA